MTQSCCLLFLVASVASGSHYGHPEWGPEPPVAPFQRAGLSRQHVVLPIVFPLVGPCRWHDDYNAPRGRYRHTGIDIKAPKMTPIVAPFSGVLGMKRESFWIYGDNGWSMLGTHLNDDNLGRHDHRGDRDVMFSPELTPGQRVEAGQFIGYVGMSGNATGPHLHFELYVPGKGPSMERLRDPAPSLRMAQRLREPRWWIGQANGRPAKGQIRLQGCVRRIDSATRTVTIILVGKQRRDGVSPVTRPRFVRLKVSEDALNAIGGMATLAALAPSQSAGFYVADVGTLQNSVVDRVLLPERTLVLH